MQRRRLTPPSPHCPPLHLSQVGFAKSVSLDELKARRAKEHAELVAHALDLQEIEAEMGDLQ